MCYIYEIFLSLGGKICQSSFLISACDCNIHGSKLTTCDNNGICSCKANFMNDKCDACASGFHHFPICHDDSVGKSWYSLYWIIKYLGKTKIYTENTPQKQNFPVYYKD